MNKLKLYLDTSVISHLEQPEQPEKRIDSWKLWKKMQNGVYAVYISATTEKEIMDCKEPKRSILINHLNSIEYSKIQMDEEVVLLSEEIIAKKILKKRNFDDCTHIAAAIIGNCDIIVSWNFKHMVNFKTINGIREITISNHYKTIDIYSPTVLIEGDDDD